MAEGAASNSASKPSVRPANREVELFNEDLFTELRASAQVPDDFINSGWDLDQLTAGGGKGGTLMVRVGSSFIVKELSEGDHRSLLSITSGYVAHVRSGQTLLCPIYIHFRDLETGRKFFAMRNGIGSRPFAGLYDLKGCADDKTIELEGVPIKAIHKRIWNVTMWCGKGGWSEDRLRYFEGKQAAQSINILMTAEQRTHFLSSLKRDTEWLASMQLMDYSLLVAVKEGSGGSAPSAPGQRPLRRKSSDGTEIALHVSIIDFLQKWTNGKRVARCLKFMEAEKATVPPLYYAQRFFSHFEQRTQAVAEELPGAPPGGTGAPPATGDLKAGGRPEDWLKSREMHSRGSGQQQESHREGRERVSPRKTCDAPVA